MGSIQLNQTAWLHVVVVALFTIMCFVGPSDTVDTALSLFRGRPCTYSRIVVEKWGEPVDISLC